MPPFFFLAANELPEDPSIICPGTPFFMLLSHFSRQEKKDEDSGNDEGRPGNEERAAHLGFVTLVPSLSCFISGKSPLFRWFGRQTHQLMQ